MKTLEKWIIVVLAIIVIGATGTAIYFGVKLQDKKVELKDENEKNENSNIESTNPEKEDEIIDNNEISDEQEDISETLKGDSDIENNNKEDSNKNNKKKPIKDKNNSSENIYVDTVIPTPCKVSFEYKIITFSDGKTFGSADWIVGEPYPEPPTPAKEGYVFKGWYLDGKKYDFSKPVMGDITLVAEWDEQINTIYFDSNGGSKVESQNLNYFKDVLKKPNNPTKKGYTFVCWELGGVCFKGFGEKANYRNGFTLTAKWGKTVDLEIDVLADDYEFDDGVKKGVWYHITIDKQYSGMTDIFVLESDTENGEYNYSYSYSQDSTGSSALYIHEIIPYNGKTKYIKYYIRNKKNNVDMVVGPIKLYGGVATPQIRIEQNSVYGSGFSLVYDMVSWTNEVEIYKSPTKDGIYTKFETIPIDGSNMKCVEPSGRKCKVNLYIYGEPSYYKIRLVATGLSGKKYYSDFSNIVYK